MLLFFKGVVIVVLVVIVVVVVVVIVVAANIWGNIKLSTLWQILVRTFLDCEAWNS
jgi:hypothetical protein